METIIVDEFFSSDMSYMGDAGYVGSTEYMEGMTGETQQGSVVNDLMSSWWVIGGATAGVLLLGIVFGLLSAKRKIKKGIDLYED